MIIGIDGNEANEKMRVGVHQYAYWTLKSLAGLKDEWDGKHEFIIYLKNPPADDFPKEFKGWKYKVIPGEGMWILKKLMPYLWKTREVDVFMSMNHYLPPVLPMPSVCAIMDLGYLENTGQFNKKDFWQLKYWSAISMNLANTIVTISQSAKADIGKHYKNFEKKTVVIPLGYDQDTFNTDIGQEAVKKVKRKYKIDGDYVLFLSTLKPSKNIEGLLEAFAQVLQNNKKLSNLSLVIAGKKGWMYDPIFRKVQELKLTDNVIFTDFISEEDKAPLLSGAKVLAAPSFWEGFGIQVLEALGCGTPVVISNIASLPEVGGKAALYCDPNDINSIAKGIEKVLSLPLKEYNELKKESLKQTKKFSWEKTARETLEILVKAGKK